MAAVLKKKSRSSGAPAATHAASCRTSKVPGEDRVCFLCHDGGTLVMCDRRQCPKAYHPACVGRTMAFFNTKGAWLCARHFCSKCSKQPCTYCVMCPNSFCSKCLSCMLSEVYLPLSEEEGLCETCLSFVKIIELQDDIEGKTTVNFEDSATVEFLFKEYWLLLKQVHGYNLTKCVSSDNVKRDVPSMVEKISSDPTTATMQNTACAGSRTKEPISVPNHSKRRSNNSGSILPAKKKIRVLKLLNDSSSEDDNENKPSSSMACGGMEGIVSSNCSKALPISKPVSAEITGAPSLFVEAILQPSVLNGKDLGAKPFSVNNISSPPKALPKLVIDDSSQPLPDLTSPLPLISGVPQPKIHPAADACKPPINYSKLFKQQPHSNKISINSPSEHNTVQSSHVACDSLVSRKEVSQSALPKPQPTIASTCKPFASERPSALPAAKTPPQPSNVSCTPILIKSHSLATCEHVQLPQDTSSQKLILRDKPVLPLKTPHGRSHIQESCKSVDASSSTCDKAETLAPITVQNVSRIYLRRSRLEELLADQRFTLVILGAFVRIRQSKHGNNYRLVQIVGSSTLQAHYYQVGEKKTNVVLEVLNLNKRQRIKIDHVSNNMFTGEECQRLQQSVELGFINAPTLRALEEKAAALQRGKANKCLDEKLAMLAGKGPSKEPGLNKEFRVNWDQGGKTPLSPNHLGKSQIQIDEVQADQVPVSVESATTIAERETELFEARIETALADKNSVGKQAVSALHQQENRHNKCVTCEIDENIKRRAQNKVEDRHVALYEAQTAAGNQADADQHSDISVEMSTVFAETGQNNIHSPEILTVLANQNCREDEAELTPPKKAQKIGLQDLGSKRCFMKEHWPSLMAETVNHAQGDAPIEAHSEIQVFGRKHMDVNHHCDVGSDLATNINEMAEDRMHADTLTSTSAVHPGMNDVAISNLPQGIPLIESREYGIIKLPTDNHIGATFQVEIQGCAEEYITTIVGLNDPGKRAVDLMQWFYQDMEEMTFGPFSLEQLRKWNRTGVFPPDLKIWRTVAGQKSFILLVDALNAQETEVLLGMASEKSIAVASGLNPLKQRGISSAESGSACHTLSKEMSGDGGVLISRTDWQSPSAHAEQRLDSSKYFGDSTASIEQAELKSGILWNSPQSTQFKIEDVSVKTCQDETSSYFEHLVTNKECEKVLNIPTQMITDGYWRLNTSETSVDGEIKCRSNPKAAEGKSNPVYTQTNEISAEGEREVLSSAAQLCAVKEIEGKSYMEGKSSSTQRSQCETPCNFEGKVIDNEPETAMQQRIGTIADTGLNFQSLAEETSSEGKREGKSVTQRQEMLTLDEGWNSPEKCDFELETWETQYDVLRKKEASINKHRDEILSNLIDAVTTEECKKGTTAESNCHTLTEDTSVYGKNISCYTEQRADDGWESPGELEHGTGWGSPNATWFNQSEQKISVVQSCHDKRVSKKLQSKQLERENTRAGGVYDGTQKNVLERDQRWTRSSPGHGRVRRVEDTDCKGSSRGRDMCLSENSCQRDFCHSKSTGGRASKLEDHAEFGKEAKGELKKFHARESIVCPKQDKSRSDQRYFSIERNTSPKSTRREVENAFVKSHSREPHKQDRLKRDQKSFSKEKVSAYEKEEEFWTSHSRNGWKSISKEQRASPENDGNRMEREVRKSHAGNDMKSISREQRASPESAGKIIVKDSKRSYAWKDSRSISKDQRASSSENARIRECKRSYSKIDQRSIPREQKVYPETAGKREVRRSHSGNDWGQALREHKASPENAGKKAEKEVRRSQARSNQRSLSKEPIASSRNAGRRNEEGDWKTHSRDDVPKDYTSFSRSVDDASRSRSFSREPRDSPAWTSSSAHRSFSRNVVDDIHKRVSREGRWERNNYMREKFSGRERGSSPCKELIQRSAHTFCPNESTLQPIQTSDQGWTPPDSPSNYPARCWSPGIAQVEKFLASGIYSKSEAHSSPRELVLPPGSPECVLMSDSFPELPPPPPLPISAAPNQMKPPPPPPLPAKTSHICHIDQYTMGTEISPP